MRLNLLRQLVPILSRVALAICWAAVIWTACHVSTIVLESLQMIVELAAISPDPS